MIISVCDGVENIVGKGETAGYQHFLLFPQCLEKASFPDASKGVIVWEWVNTSVEYMYVGQENITGISYLMLCLYQDIFHLLTWNYNCLK